LTNERSKLFGQNLLVKVSHIAIEFFYRELNQLRLDPRVNKGKTST